MESKNRHPLECITNCESLSMLESLIPFVEYPLKLPLALFIKFTEIRLIINAFRSVDNLSRLGLHSASSSPTDMLCALTGMSPEMLKMLMSLSENTNGTFSPEMLSGLTGQNGMDISNIVNMFNQFNKGGTDGPPPPFHASGTSDPPTTREYTESSSDDSFDAAIQNILAEYDMSQAEGYTNDISNNDSDQEVFP